MQQRQVQTVAVEQGGGVQAPVGFPLAVALDSVEAPDFLAVHVEGDEIAAAVKDVYALAVGARGIGGVIGFRRIRFNPSRGAELAFPADLALGADAPQSDGSPHTTGVEPALPGGNGSFQAMFLVSLHSVGTFFSWDIPLSVGPRQSGQLSAQAMAPQEATISELKTHRRFTAVSL
jgi:hypothetical protein